MIPGLSVTNSLAFSPDGRRMYFCDTLRRLIWQADMEPRTGAILGMREFVRLAETEISDGAAMDIDGGYWLAIFGAGEVRRYRPDGALDRTLTMPFSQPTKVAFGGPHLTTIYVTSTRIEFPGFPRSGMNGAIQEIDVGIKGMPEFFFAG
jgi:sugar lactone lactonase YvrE